MAGGPVRRLVLKPSATQQHRVFISNLPAQNSAIARLTTPMSDEEMAALHFGAYYELLKHEPRRRGRMPGCRLRTSVVPPAAWTRSVLPAGRLPRN